MRLNEFQAQFKNLMLDHPSALENPPKGFAAFCQEGSIPLAERLKVYRNNIVGGITDVLVATFPLIEVLVGKAFLEGMARSFLLKHPPTQGCLSLYGDGFAEFIKGFEPAAGLPYLPDMARLELAMNKAYYAADDAPMHAEDLAAIAPEALGDLKLRTRDHVQLLQSDYPLLALKDFCDQKGEGEAPDLNAGGVYLMIYRPQFDTEIARLQADEYEMLRALQSGATLGDAVEATLNAHPEFDFQAFLQKHIALETFLALEANR